MSSDAINTELAASIIATARMKQRMSAAESVFIDLFDEHTKGDTHETKQRVINSLARQLSGAL